jgi:glycosyltransferase involved in cell wall biosynthesis
VPTVLHILPHPGGGAETYIDLLEGLEGYSHRRVALSSTRSRLHGVGSVIGRRRRILREAAEVDLVHVHGDMAAMLLAPALGGRPLVFTTHGLHRLRRSAGAIGALVGRRLRTAVEASARTICLTRSEREELSAVLPRALDSHLAVVPNGVPLPPETEPEERTRARRSLGLGDDEVCALFVGQLEERKDPLGAACAAESAQAGGARIVLLLAGAGPLEREVSARQSAVVRPLGHREDLEELYTAADLFLLPSRREGMSFALLEAMAHGLVPVVAEGAGNAETVGEAGALFAPGDLGALSELLVRLAADAEERMRLGAAARERIRSELSLEHFLTGTREQYEAALGGGAPPQGA